MSQNRLKDLNLEVAKALTDLIDLDVSFNFLPVYPYEEGHLLNLKKLDIRGNPILSIPKFIVQTKLDTVYFEWNNVLREESYLKGSPEPKTSPNMNTLSKNDFAIPINNFRMAFEK